MKTILLLFILSIFSSFYFVKSQSVTELLDSKESPGTIETVKSGASIYSFTLTSKLPTNITVTPCFGTFDIYVSLNKIVTNKSATYYGAWDPTVKALGTNLKALPENTIIYIAVMPLEEYDFKNTTIAASFTVLISTNEKDLVLPYLPVPAREGGVDIKLTNGGKSGTISFYKTGNSTDSYTIYTFYGTRPKGSFPFSACGVKFYATENNQKIEDNGDNEASATFTGLNTKEPTGLTVVVTRKTKNFASAYDYAVFNAPNSSSSLKSTFLNLIPAFFICIFISFLLL
ncbi:hypothetical protein RB653_001014 [Dictyostelium firmibasis]|uniref:Uncharacterized protein n=1 Tax=Dictyostelium firmibasis TaxID=79012 RepID=A0AAN7YYD3_9MYCE